MPFPERTLLGSHTGTGLCVHGPISGTGLCHFRYGPSLGPVPEVDSTLVVAFCSKEESGSAFLLVLTAKSGVFCYVHYGKVGYIGIRAAKFCVRSLYSFVTEHASEPENEENERSTQFWKWDFPLLVLVSLLEMGVLGAALIKKIKK